MMAERNAKRTNNETVLMPLLSVLSISSCKLAFFSVWSVLIVLSIFPWQLSILIAIFTGFVEGKRKLKALLLSIISLTLGWGFMLLYFVVKSRGKILSLASDFSIILFGNTIVAPLLLLSPLIIASILGFFGGLIGLYARELLEMRTASPK